METIKHMALYSFFSLGISATVCVHGQAQSVQKEFDDGPGKFYNYAPSYIQTSDSERYMCVCRNKESGIIKDHIVLRKARLLARGSWQWGSPQIILAPSTNPADWDYKHTCDPEIRKGQFLYKGRTYSWVMFYLGVRLMTDMQNQIGIAFADQPEGPWAKYEGNPFITTATTTHWGVGQPAATSIDGIGKFFLYYTRIEDSGVRLMQRSIDLHNMDKPVIGTEYAVFTKGLVDRDRKPTTSMQGAAFAHEPRSGRIYMVRGHLPFGGAQPDFISTELQLAYTSEKNIRNNSGVWTVDGYINPGVSGKARNFDAGFLTDPFGVLIGGTDHYQPSFAVSDTGKTSLWSYRMYRIEKSDLANNPTPYEKSTGGQHKQ